jgi:hypothetical protein
MVGQVGVTLWENSALVEKQPYVPNADVMRPIPRLDQPSPKKSILIPLSQPEQDTQAFCHNEFPDTDRRRSTVTLEYSN